MWLPSVFPPPPPISMLVVWPLSLDGEQHHLVDHNLMFSRRWMSPSSPTASVKATTAPAASPPPWSVPLTPARTPAKETLVVPWSHLRMEDMPRLELCHGAMAVLAQTILEYMLELHQSSPGSRPLPLVHKTATVRESKYMTSI